MKTREKNLCDCFKSTITRSKGEFLIIVIRTSFTINKDLPYIIWGSNYINDNGFAKPLQPYLPSGVTVVTSITAATGAVVFAYTDGVNTDFIEVLSIPTALISYNEMLSNINTNYLKTELMYFNNNANVNLMPVLTELQNKVLQSKPLYFQKIGMSKLSNEVIIPFSRRGINNSVPELIEINMRQQEIKPDTYWVHQFGYIGMTEPRPLVFYWEIIINDIINLNDEKMSLSEIKEKSQV